MRIGLITSDLSTDNGWATYSQNLIRGLQARGIKTTVVCSHNSPKTDFETYPLLPTVTPPERHTLLKCVLRSAEVRRLLSDCDIVHSTVEPYAILAASVAGRRPLFVTAHGSYVNLPRIRSFPVNQLYLRAFRRAQMICVSRYTAKIAMDMLPPAQVHVISNGVAVSKFAQVPPLDIGKTGPTIVAAGGIKPRKGTLQLVEAIASVREQIPQLQCLIMGPPQYGSAYTTRVQAEIERLELQDNVYILGFVDDEVKRAWFAAADVLALPALNDGWYFEGFGLVLYEAGAAGTAVVGTDGCGVADAIEHGVTGLIVSQQNIGEELPQALLQLLQHPQHAAEMGAAGRLRAKEQTWDKVAGRVIELYQDALATNE